MKTASHTFTMVSLAAVLLGAGTSAYAGSLLNTANQNMLDGWLGESATFTNIYTKVDGDTSLNFHAAVDGKGATISLMEATNALGQTWLIGGYNPQSWSSSAGFNVTPDNAQRTAFIFNLTSDVMHKQTPDINGLGTVGAYQTFNGAQYGPSFGIGFDIYVPFNMTSGGLSSLYSYIDPVSSGFNTSLLDGSIYKDIPTSGITYGAIEVFKITAVPEPASYGMLLAGLALLACACKRRLRNGSAANSV